MAAGRRRSVKREAILDAGSKAFLALGYAGTSMDLVARVAGVSKRTVYGHFASKRELFAAIVRDISERVLAPLDSSGDRRDPEATLHDLARQLLDVVLAPEVVELHRIVTFEAPRFPELAREYYDSGVGHAVETLSDYFAEEARRGRLAIRRPRFAAEHFVGMIIGLPYAHALLKVAPRKGTFGRDQDLREAVRTFLDGCRSRSARRRR